MKRQRQKPTELNASLVSIQIELTRRKTKISTRLFDFVVNYRTETNQNGMRLGRFDVNETGVTKESFVELIEFPSEYRIIETEEKN